MDENIRAKIITALYLDEDADDLDILIEVVRLKEDKTPRIPITYPTYPNVWPNTTQPLITYNTYEGGTEPLVTTSVFDGWSSSYGDAEI